MAITRSIFELQGNLLAFDLLYVELLGKLINLSLTCGRDAVFDEILVTLRIFSLRGVDANQADFADGVNLESVAIVNPEDSALQGQSLILCTNR